MLALRAQSPVVTTAQMAIHHLNQLPQGGQALNRGFFALPAATGGAISARHFTTAATLQY